MTGLEPNSRQPAREAEAGRMRHGCGEALDRHRHDRPFAAIVLAGGYVEAGDTGRHRVTAGDVLTHRAWESHLDRFAATGAEVLVLPLGRDWGGPVRGRLSDPDLVARLAERDEAEACAALATQLQAVDSSAEDWPDLLAAALLDDPDLAIADWSRAHGLHPGSASRGFQQQFGLTPARFRATVRAHRAVRAIDGGTESLSEIAAATGFADQAHMTRAVAALTGLPPGALRRQPVLPSRKRIIAEKSRPPSPALTSAW